MRFWIHRELSRVSRSDSGCCEQVTRCKVLPLWVFITHFINDGEKSKSSSWKRQIASVYSSASELKQRIRETFFKFFQIGKRGRACCYGCHNSSTIQVAMAQVLFCRTAGKGATVCHLCSVEGGSRRRYSHSPWIGARRRFRFLWFWSSNKNFREDGRCLSYSRSGGANNWIYERAI